MQRLHLLHAPSRRSLAIVLILLTASATGLAGAEPPFAADALGICAETPGAADTCAAIQERICSIDALVDAICPTLHASWMRTKDTQGFVDGPFAMAVSPDGARIYIGGESRSTPSVTTRDMSIIAYDANGNELWATLFDGGELDTVRAISVHPDGSLVYVTGETWRAEPRVWFRNVEFITLAYDADSGELAWEERYDASGTNQLFASATALAVSPDGATVFVTGTSERVAQPRGESYATVAYDARTGTLKWVARDDSTWQAIPTSVTISPDSARVFVTGEVRASVENAHNTDAVTVAYDAQTGETLWTAVYDKGDLDTAADVETSHDGERVFVTGHVRRSASDTSVQVVGDIMTLAYDATTGALLWEAHFNGAATVAPVHDAAGQRFFGWDHGRELKISPDDRTIYVLGSSILYYTFPFGTSPAYTTLAYDAQTGDLLWSALYETGLMRQDIFSPNSLAVSPDGTRVFTTGTTQGDEHALYISTVAYDASTGRLDAIGRYGDGDALVVTPYLGVSPDGETLFMTGRSGDDLVTIAYALDGNVAP